MSEIKLEGPAVGGSFLTPEREKELWADVCKGVLHHWDAPDIVIRDLLSEIRRLREEASWGSRLDGSTLAGSPSSCPSTTRTTAADSGGWTRTNDQAVNSRSLYQLSYPGMARE